MQSKLILLLTLSVVCLQTISAGPLYTLNDKRYQELLVKVNEVQFADQKSVLLTISSNSFGFNCTQVRGLLGSFLTDGDRLSALTIFKNNIIDPTNKQKQIIEMFNITEDRQRATGILANIAACKVVPFPNDPYPPYNIPYSNTWEKDDLDNLIKVITHCPPAFGKVRIAEVAIMSRTEILAPEQLMLLFSVFSSHKDILQLRGLIKERIVGLNCQQFGALLERFSFGAQKANILDTLQCANNNSTCMFNNDLLSLADFIHINMMGSTCEKISPIGERFTFEEQKLELLEGFSSSVVDIENKNSLLNAFYFASNKEKAKKIIDGFKPNSYLFGSPSGKVAFVIDVSGSMGTTFRVNGTQTLTRLAFARQELSRILNSFNESIAFTALTFADKVVPWNNNLVNATQTNIKSAGDFVNRISANGGTNSHEALRVAFNTTGVETIYFLSDGNPNVGNKTDPNAIIADVKLWNSKRNITVNSIALIMGTTSGEDKAVAKKFMKMLSETTGGAYRILESAN